MARYFFHIVDGDVLTDEAGTELAGLAEARAHAIETAGVMIREQSLKKWQGRAWLLHVTDEAGDTALRLRFSAERIDTVEGGLSAFGHQAAYAVKRHLSEDEAQLVHFFRALPEGEIRQTIVDLVAKIASEIELSVIPHLN